MKFSSYIRKFRRDRAPHIWLNIFAFSHILGSPSSYNIWLCNRSHLNSLWMRQIFFSFFSFLSVCLPICTSTWQTCGRYFIYKIEEKLAKLLIKNIRLLFYLSLYSVFIVSRRGFVIIYLKSLKLEIYCTYKDRNSGLGRTIHYDCLE
jgi:hypothetical protein